MAVSILNGTLIFNFVTPSSQATQQQHQHQQQHL